MILRPGDLIIFYGKGILSWLIELFSAGPSHCAIVRQNYDEVLITESTIDKINGVQTHPLNPIVESYNGSIAALLLSDDARKRMDLEAFYAFLGSTDGLIKYDIPGLFEFLLREIPIVGVREWQTEKQKQMVCSAFVCAALIKSKIIAGVNWTQVTPQMLVEMGIYKSAVILKGNPKLKRFNSLALKH